ncbi:hypothetical protein FXO38_27789 [Capsicum annuum]|nr:hypothetical protein FXO38_27789 [Capsicum annuum]KAF3653744.1 hypothetical protein FXO37_16815 [Capsicum annuum]
MSWLRSAVSKAVEVGGAGNRNLSRNLRYYADSVVQQASNAVSGGAKLFLDRSKGVAVDVGLVGIEPEMPFSGGFRRSSDLTVVVGVPGGDSGEELAKNSLTNLFSPSLSRF